MTNAYKYGRPVADEIYCILLGSSSLSVSAKYATKIGLVVITLERYVKVQTLFERHIARDVSSVSVIVR